MSAYMLVICPLRSLRHPSQVKRAPVTNTGLYLLWYNKRIYRSSSHEEEGGGHCPCH